MTSQLSVVTVRSLCCGQHGVYCVKLSGEDLSRYSNETNIYQSLPYIIAEELLAWVWYQETASLSPYVYCRQKKISTCQVLVDLGIEL